MKKNYYLLILLCFILSQSINATVWRVNNRPNVDADFTTLQAAIDGASDSDTLYIGASETTYGSGIFTKKLIVIGAGYWHSENDTTQAYHEESQTGRLTFNDGAQGSEVMGLYIYENNTNDIPSPVKITTNNIKVKRNKIVGNRYYNHNTAKCYGIWIINNLSSIIISQNWISTTGADQTTKYCIVISGIVTNTSISNNFLYATQSNKHSIYMESNSTATELIINNNVMWGHLTTYYTIHNNNILIDGSYNNSAGDLTSHNLCSATQYPATNSNQQNVDMSTVFIDYIGYIDNDYKLATGSPAIGAGINGGDCGAFGSGSGTEPYVLSGLPPIPSVFEATVTTIGSSVLPVNIKVSSHN